MTSVYVASSMYDRELTSKWMRKLEDAGFGITCDWPAAMDQGRSLEDSALEDIHGALTADIVWCQVSAHMSRGMWTEYGMAVGQLLTSRNHAGKHIILSGDDEHRMGCVFAHYKHPRILHFKDHAEAFAYILRI